MAAIGDSLTVAFNAKANDFYSCRFDDEKEYSYASNTSDNATDSLVERLNATNDTAISVWNVGEDGAEMRHGIDQALKIKSSLIDAPAPRLVTVFLGHNDICGTGGVYTKVNSSCGSSDGDPNNYCRTSSFYYEKYVRQMMDVLITIPKARIGIVTPVPVSQLCNHRDRQVTDTFLGSYRCNDLYNTVDLFDDAGICRSLTYDCSNARIAHAYNTWAQYNAIMERVGAEYQAIAAGVTVPVNATFATGGVVKANGISVQVTSALGKAKFTYKDSAGNVMLSKCDCFHATRYGQQYIANLIWDGLTCSSDTPCCDDAQNTTSVLKGKCAYNKTDGSYVPGLW